MATTSATDLPATNPLEQDFLLGFAEVVVLVTRKFEHMMLCFM